MSALFDGIAGAVTGLLSGWGTGGGSLLMVYMVMLRGMEQQAAQGINLLYFLPAAGGALIEHIKNKRVDKTAVLCSLIGGVPVSLVFAFVAQNIDAAWLRRLFGVLLLYVGLMEMFHKKK